MLQNLWLQRLLIKHIQDSVENSTVDHVAASECQYANLFHISQETEHFKR